MTNDQQDSIADQLSIAANPQMLLISAFKKVGMAKDSYLGALIAFTLFTLNFIPK